MKLLTEKRKKSILIYLILWLLLAIVFIMPLSVAIVDSTNPLTGSVEMDSLKSIIGDKILDLGSRFTAFDSSHIAKTKEVMLYYSLLFGGLLLVFTLKKRAKGDYDKIEHGSSDWCEGGEQYKVLSRRSGLMLAQNNFLPVDKPGNVNVLIVGRIWFW